MKRTQLIILAILISLLAGLTSARAQGTAFTYQGHLTESGNPANGDYDFAFLLYDAATNGNQVGSTVIVRPVAVSNGLFTVELDFGAAPFAGDARWLEISVAPFGLPQPSVVLSPRQPITSTPYAIRAAREAEGVSPNFSNCRSRSAGSACLYIKVSGHLRPLSSNECHCALFRLTHFLLVRW